MRLRGCCRLTPKIYRECHNELVMFPLRKARLADRKQEIYDAGGDKSYKDEPHGNHVSSPLDKKLNQLLAYDITEDERRIRQIEEVLSGLTPIQRHFYEYHYRQGLNIFEASDRMAYSRETGKRIKRQIIVKVAVRLGLIR